MDGQLIGRPGAPIAKRPLKDVVRHVFWDLDGTLFRKTREIQNAQLFFIYNAFEMCRRMMPEADDPFAVSRNLIFPTIKDVPEEVVRAVTSLQFDKETNPDGKYSSFGRMFTGEFGKEQAYSPKVVSTIDYRPMVPRDEKLIKMFELLMAKYPWIKHSIMTSDTREALDSVCLAVGLDVNKLLDPRVDELFPPNPELVRGSKYANGNIGILCAYNLEERKPARVAYRQVLKVAGLEKEPERVLYVGDSEVNDVIPADELGITTCLVWTEKTQSTADFNLRVVYDLPELFERC